MTRATPSPASLWLLAALVLLLSVTAASVQAGQKELMQAWEARKRSVTDQVYEQLRREGRLPRDGTVEFKAFTRPDPDTPGQVRVEVDEVRITSSPEGLDPSGFESVDPAGSGKGTAAATRSGTAQNKRVMIPPVRMETIDWQPMDVSSYISCESLDIPVGQELQGRFEVRKGVLLPAQPGGWETGGPEPAEP